MITLHDEDEYVFTTQGLGSLYEASACEVVEELNGEFELEMDYPVTGKRYSDLALRKIIVTKATPEGDLSRSEFTAFRGL